MARVELALGHQGRPLAVRRRSAQPPPAPVDTATMKLWYDAQDGRAILKLPTRVPGLGLELVLYFSDDGTRAIWVWSQTRRIAWWPPVGVC